MVQEEEGSTELIVMVLVPVQVSSSASWLVGLCSDYKLEQERKHMADGKKKKKKKKGSRIRVRLCVPKNIKEYLLDLVLSGHLTGISCPQSGQSLENANGPSRRGRWRNSVGRHDVSFPDRVAQAHNAIPSSVSAELSIQPRRDCGRIGTSSVRPVLLRRQQHA